MHELIYQHVRRELSDQVGSGIEHGDMDYVINNHCTEILKGCLDCIPFLKN